MNEHRRKILEMLVQGQINADEAERLISALEKAPAPSAPVKAKPKYLRVVVKSDNEEYGEAPMSVNVRVPMQLLRAGVKLANLIPVQARIQVNEALREQGVQFDLNQIKPENLEELIDSLDELTVDVDEKSTKDRVFCE